MEVNGKQNSVINNNLQNILFCAPEERNAYMIELRGE